MTGILPNMGYMNNFSIVPPLKKTHEPPLLIHNYYASQIDNKKTCSIFLDIKKAFDSVSHPILLKKKLYRYGFRGKIFNLLQNYLNNRFQYVFVNQTTSNILPIKCGIPQGSSRVF